MEVYPSLKSLFVTAESAELVESDQKPRDDENRIAQCSEKYYLINQFCFMIASINCKGTGRYIDVWTDPDHVLRDHNFHSFQEKK